MAGYAVASVPLVVLFLFTMRLFVKGLAAGAVKG
jgi:ABC-type glycerol-3-phosphate transport system permease component